MDINKFFKGKTVLVTGHTGFKGAWLTIWLEEMGAKVIGYALDPEYEKSIFDLANLKEKIIDIRANINDLEKLKSVFKEHKPEIVFHLAAQAIVRKSYDDPRETFETNIMGTVNILECLREFPIKSSVIITSDKCYKNIEQNRGYIETDAYSDQDPYSTSKGCAEMVTQSYRHSYGLKVATARAGNVLGGGDWAKDRIIPDFFRALESDQDMIIRNPDSVRPWQHVLEPLYGYLLLAQKQYQGEDLNEGWNFGPNKNSMVPVKDLIDSIKKRWGKGEVIISPDTKKKEAGLLYLSSEKSKSRLGWKPRLDINKMSQYIVDWYKNYSNEDVYKLCVKQIKKYENEKILEEKQDSKVKVIDLKVFEDDRGKVKRMMRSDDPHFTKFGDIYFSTVYPGKVKAWHKNKKSFRFYAVPKGKIKLVLYDGKNYSQEIILGENDYSLVAIPPNIWSGFKNIGSDEAIIADLTETPFNEEDNEKVDQNKFLKCWE